MNTYEKGVNPLSEGLERCVNAIVLSVCVRSHAGVLTNSHMLMYLSLSPPTSTTSVCLEKKTVMAAVFCYLDILDAVRHHGTIFFLVCF